MKTLKFSPVAFAIALTMVQSAPAQTWSQTSAPIKDWYSVASSGDGNKLVAVTEGGVTNQGILFTILPGPIYTSTNSGLSWNATGAPTNVWQSVASSDDGNEYAAVPMYGGICISRDAGLTWAEATNAPTAFWWNVAISADGSTIAATMPGAGAVAGGIYLSTDAGVTWAPSGAPTHEDWDSLAVSADGVKMIAGSIDGWVYFSTNTGAAWTQASLPNIVWGAVAASSNGIMVAAVNSTPAAYGGPIYISTNSGSTWSPSSAPIAGWQAVAMSADGTRLVAGNASGQIYTSPDSGATWLQNSAPKMGWTALASSADGAKLVAAVNGGGIYIPMLGITGVSGGVALSWPSNSLDFQLQQSFDPAPASWTVTTNVPVLNLTTLQYELTLPATNRNGFYRIQPAQTGH